MVSQYFVISLINLDTLQIFDNMRQSNPLSIILEQHRLTSPNFVDWLRNLKFVLAYEKILYVLTQSPPEPLPADVSQEERDMLQK